MRRASKLLPRISKPPHHINNHFPRPLSTNHTTTDHTSQTPTPPSERDSLILQKFRQRKLQGGLSPKPNTNTNTNAGFPQSPSFEELGLEKELVLSCGEVGILSPGEVQCVGIPAVLEGKSVVLSSESGSGRTSACFLALLQLLRREEAVTPAKAQHPRAIVLCSTEELADEGFRLAKFISHFARLKSAEGSKSSVSGLENVADSQMGLLIGTPAEILQQMQDGSVVGNDVKYLVLDDADIMFDLGFGPDIVQIVKPLKDRSVKSNHRRLQAVLVASSLTKILGKEFSPLVESLEKFNKGKVTTMMLEMDQAEIFDILESPNTLQMKLADAVKSLTSGQ